MNSLELKKQAQQKIIESNVVHHLDDVQEGVDILRKYGRPKGWHLGFECLKDYYSVLPGKTTYLYGSPYTGKSYITFEYLLNIAKYYDKRIGVFSVEMGTPEEVYWDLIQMQAKVNCYFDNQSITDQDYKLAKEFVREYFYVIDPKDRDLTVNEFLDTPKEIKRRWQKDIDILMGDPFDEFDVDVNEMKFRDIYVGRQLKTIRKQSENTGVHTWIINHARDQAKVKKAIKDTEQVFEYYPIVTPRELFGGQEWFRKGLGMISLWRPPEGLPDENGYPAQKNEIWVIIQKAKPRGIGKTGIVKLYLDHERHRYYEESTIGTRRYARKMEDDSLELERESDLSQLGNKEERAPF